MSKPGPLLVLAYTNIMYALILDYVLFHVAISSLQLVFMGIMLTVNIAVAWKSAMDAD